MASQRHKLWEHGATSAGEIHAQGVVAPGIAMQVDPSAPAGTLKAGPPLYNTGLELRSPPDMSDVVVPIGDPGGPLSGSTLTGAIPEELLPEPAPPNPEPGEEPVLNSINPSSARIGSADVTMNVNGNNFTDTSVIYFNGGAEPTTFNSTGQLSTIVKPSTATVTGEFPVHVQQGAYSTTSKMFEFLPENAELEEGERVFPIGPITIATVDDHADGIALTLSEAADVQVGDTVLIEATGNTSVNGSYSVLTSDGTTVIVDNNFELLASIEAKGRLTVTG